MGRIRKIIGGNYDLLWLFSAFVRTVRLRIPQKVRLFLDGKVVNLVWYMWKPVKFIDIDWLTGQNRGF
jgi:hypothetical protein